MEEINLYDLLRFYIKKWLTIAIFVMIGGIVGIAYTYYIQTPQYESKATLLLVGTNRTAANQESVALNNLSYLNHVACLSRLLLTKDTIKGMMHLLQV